MERWAGGARRVRSARGPSVPPPTSPYPLEIQVTARVAPLTTQCGCSGECVFTIAPKAPLAGVG
jgi:hypothetical protein